MGYIGHVIFSADESSIPIDLQKDNDFTEQTEDTVSSVPPKLVTMLERLNRVGIAVHEAVRNAALVLLSRAESHLAEVLLILVREEVDRFKGRQWKEIYPKLFAEKGLIYPSLFGQPDIMGFDYMIPVSQVETIRKELQVFLLLRALSHYLATTARTSSELRNVPFELCNFISDTGFLSLEEESIVPVALRVGSPYDMKGKKFLDSTVVLPMTSTTNSVETANNGSKALPSRSSQVNSLVTASATSIFTFGMFGSSSRSSLGGRSSITNGSSSSSGANGGRDAKQGRDGILSSALGHKLLFVQDNTVLQLVSTTKVDGKSVFKMNVAAPLLFTDAKLDLENKKRLKIFVRSWIDIGNMQKSVADEDNSPRIGSSSSQSRTTLFLKPARKATLYEIELIMDTEQAAALAIQHVENRRRALHAQKLEEFKRKVSYWTSEQRKWSDLLPNAES